MSQSCLVCGKRSYSDYCVRHKPRKPIKVNKRPRQIGRAGQEYIEWRDMIARPFLDRKYGRVCSKDGCRETENLDVDHIAKRGSHPELKMTLSNVRYLCRRHHIEIT